MAINTRIIWVARSAIPTPASGQVNLFLDSANETVTYKDDSGNFHFTKKWTTAAMSGTSLVHNDADATTTSRVVWNASAQPNWFIEVITWAGTITFNSTVAETVSFTYSLIE